jgi:hypothetical protein
MGMFPPSTQEKVVHSITIGVCMSALMPNIQTFRTKEINEIVKDQTLASSLIQLDITDNNFGIKHSNY